MRKPVLAGLLALSASGWAMAQNNASLTGLETYGTFESGGVVASITGDANGNASASLEWRAQGESNFRPAHPLVRIDASHFVGSLFWLQPGQAYDVRVTLSDGDGVTGSPSATADLATRAENAAF